MGFFKTLLRIVSLLLVVGLLASTCIADEVIIDKKSGSNKLGDFDCSPCQTASTKPFYLFEGNESSGKLTAGDLWQYFDSQGVSSLDRLTFCLDLQTDGISAKSGINSMELTIEDPSNLGSLLTNVSLGDKKLRMHDYDIASHRPEARLELDLGYDFMKRFSATSREKISIDVAGEANSEPRISIEGGNGFFTSKFNSWALGAFAIFWALVFIALNRFTKPQVIAQPPQKLNPPKRQALSA